MRWLLIVVGACSSKPPATSQPGPPQQAPADAAIVRPIDAPTVAHVAADAAPLECIVDAREQQACEARGFPFEYGRHPVMWCSGTRTPNGWWESETAKAKASPCECIDTDALQRQQNDCGRRP